MDSEGDSYQLITVDVNETHPAVVRCEATCLNQQGIYNPAMALIVTSQEQFIEVHGAMNVSSTDGLYEIYYENISHCGAQNNYTMKFNFLIYSTSSKIDHAVLVCGVMYSVDTPCWGQTNGIIRYNSDLATTTQQPSKWNMRSPPYSPSPLFATTPSSTTHEMTASGPRLSNLKLVLLYIVISIVIIIVLSVPVVAGFLYTYMFMRSNKKTAVTEEEGLEMKTVQVHSNEGEGEKKEKETVPAKVSHPSLIHSRLNQKLPDTISSRENK